MRTPSRKTRVLVLAAGSAFLCLVATGTAHAGSINFAPKVDSPTGGNFPSWGPGPSPGGTATADFNGDGTPDLVMADFSGPGPVILTGKGDGTFNTGTRVGDVGIGYGAVAAGDLNGDGKPDVVAQAWTFITTFLNNGDGTFKKAETVPTIEGAQQEVAVADVNNDGKADVLSLIPNGVKTWFGKGNGQLDGGPTAGVPGVAAAFTVGNFNKDKNIDIAINNDLLQRVNIFFGKGDGSWDDKGSGASGIITEDIRAGDFNGDGIDDIITADSFSFSTTLLTSDGRGGFKKTDKISLSGLGPDSIAVGDFNHDGKLDAAMSAVLNGKIVIFSGNGNGTIKKTSEHDVTVFPQTPVVADYNHDGKPDIAVAGAANVVSFLKNIS